MLGKGFARKRTAAAQPRVTRVLGEARVRAGDAAGGAGGVAGEGVLAEGVLAPMTQQDRPLDMLAWDRAATWQRCRREGLSSPSKRTKTVNAAENARP